MWYGIHNTVLLANSERRGDVESRDNKILIERVKEFILGER